MHRVFFSHLLMEPRLILYLDYTLYSYIEWITLYSYTGDLFSKASTLSPEPLASRRSNPHADPHFPGTELWGALVLRIKEAGVNTVTHGSPFLIPKCPQTGSLELTAITGV